MPKALSFNTKLLLSTIGVVIVSIIILTSVNLWQSNQSLTNLGLSTIGAVGDTLYRDIEIQHQLTQEKVHADLATLERELSNLGQIFINNGQTQTKTIVNQVTQAQETVVIPTMSAGGNRIDDHQLVDRVQKMAGGTATVFQVLPDKLLRISTNVRKTDGERAVGTYIPESSPVYQAVMRGETYLGRAFVVNTWYITAYKPIKDIQGEIAAVLYVGRPIMNPQNRKLIIEANIGGKGQAFVYNTQGEILLHPDEAMVGKRIENQSFGDRLLSVTNGYVDYDSEGQHNLAYARYFEPWDWNIVVGITDDDLLNKARQRIYIVSAVAAAALLGLAALLAMGVVRTVAKPLHRLEAYTREVATGNFNATIDYSGRDAIGETIEAVRLMVVEMKHKLGYARGILDGMTTPCLVVDTSERITFINEPCLDMLQLDGPPERHHGELMSQVFYNDPTRQTVVGKSMKTGEITRNLDVQIKGHKGGVVHVLANIAPLADLDGKTIGGFCIYVDLTTIKEHETQIHQQNERIAQVAREADHISEIVSSAAEELSAQVEQASRGSEIQSSRAGETATAMEQMNASVLEVAKSASNAAESADQAKEKAAAGEAKVRQVIAAISEVDRQAATLQQYMSELGQRADGIGQIITVIEDIADQTNLLALNAAIEAARAGDAGRGFAVVADEVRKLAEKTMNATKEVASAIASIQQGASKSIEATRSATEAVGRSTRLAEESGQAMHEIVRIADATAGQVQSIATASEEQSAASEEINHAVEEINRISAETADGMSQSAKAVSDLAKQALELKRLIEGLNE
ncbi:MAG: Cache 3/Cache 2 fusion domain-containing protein [Desulfocurvibacter africanus]